MVMLVKVMVSMVTASSSRAHFAGLRAHICDGDHHQQFVEHPATEIAVYGRRQSDGREGRRHGHR